MRVQVARIGFVIGEAVYKRETQVLFIKNYYEFPGGDSIALKRVTAHTLT